MISQDFLIRLLTPEDDSFLHEMLYQAIFVPEGSALPPRHVVQLPELHKYVSGFGSWPGDIGYVAIDGNEGRNVGAAWYRLFSKENRGYGTVDDTTPELTIAVDSAYRGQGIGTALLERLLEAARKHYSAVSLSVWPQNPAYRLYRRFGFEFAAQEENGPAVTLVKRFGARDRAKAAPI